MPEINKVTKFLETKSDLPKIIIIYWPTACWKTGLSIKIAKHINWEIIWADSRQIYRWMDIWTGKIKEVEKEWIQHYMIDIINPDNNYSVAEFKKESENIIKDLHSRNITPIICWWTWLYLDSIAYNFSIPEIEPDWNYREELEMIRLEKWNEFLWEMLNIVDEEYAKKLSPNNYRYVMRWLEVFKKTGKSKLELKWQKDIKYDILFLTPYDWDRPKLYNRINIRIEEMFEEWLIDEVKELLKIYTPTSFGLNTIWYKEVINYINWNLSLEECKIIVKQHNRNYAKRQLTWFKKYTLK